MSEHALELFVGRDVQARLFEDLLRNDGSRWVMLVDGLSGTGKRALLDWLRRNKTGGIPTARIELSASVGRGDRLLHQIVRQLDPDLGADFTRALAELASEERHQPLLHYAPTYNLNIQARWGGKISESSQSAAPVLELGPEYLSIIQDARRSQRLELLERTLAPLGDRKWVLFVAEAGHLDNKPVRELFLDEIVCGLRERFPGFRLYLTGETVPQSAFRPDERITSTLEPLEPGDATTLFRAAGLADADAARAYDLTLGHPFLIRLYVERVKASAGAPLFGDRGGQWALDERARTQWIYDSVLAAIPDEKVRGVAEQLALLEWFDPSLLRTVFDVPLADRDIEDLVRRSFVRPLPNGRWRCHDVIRKYLPPQLMGRDRTGAMALQRAAFGAFRERIAQETERTGGPAFHDRLDLAVAAVHSAAAFSNTEAEAFALSELALALIELEEDYVYAFARSLDRSDAPPALTALGRQAKEALELINARQWTDAGNDLVDRLATHADAAGLTAVAAALLRFAALISSYTGRHDAAIGLARRAAAAADSVDARLLLARATAGAGRTDETASILSDARTAFGDSAALRVAEGNLALARGDKDDAARRYTDAIAAFPGETLIARLRLAELLVQRREFDAALSQADAILEREPSHEEAASLRLDVLAHLGRIGDLLDGVGQLAGRAHRSVDLFRGLTVALADPRMRGRLLTMLQLDPAAVPVPIALVLCDVLAGEGAVDRVMEVTRGIDERHPRARPLCDTKRASALLAVGRVDEAIALVEPLVSVGASLPDAYILLARCRLLKGEGEGAREVLRQVAIAWPALRDAMDAQIAGSYAAEGRIDDAIAHLAAQERAGPLGPIARVAQAGLIAERDPDRALTLFEEVIHTYSRDEMVLVMMINTRLAYAMLLARKGRRDEAARVAQSLRERFAADDPEALIAAAKIYAQIGDADSLRQMFAASTGADPRTRGLLLGAMVGLVLARKPSPSVLFRALEAEPDRLELVGALLPLLNAANTSDLRADMQRVERIAPATLSTYLEISNQLLAVASPTEMAALSQFVQLADDPIRRIGVARLLGSLGKISVEAARRELHEVAATRTQFAEVAISAEAEMLIALDRTADAAAVLAPYLEQDEPPEAVLPGIACLHAVRNDDEAAIRLFRGVAARLPDQRRGALEAMVDLLNRQKRYDEALETLAELEREAPLNDELLISRANALRDLERYDEALAALSQAEALPKLLPVRRGQVIRSRAVCLREAARLDEAILAFHEAISLMPRDGFARLGLAKALRAAGRWSEAYEAMLDGVALAPSRMKIHEADLRDLRERAAGGAGGVLADAAHISDTVAAHPPPPPAAADSQPSQ